MADIKKPRQLRTFKVRDAKILVTGSRTLDIKYWDPNKTSVHSDLLKDKCRRAKTVFIDMLATFVHDLEKEYGSVTVISGGCPHGADQWAIDWVNRINKPNLMRVNLWVMEADWARHGKRAGFLRNKQMVAQIERTDPHRVLTAWDGESKGTKNTIDLCLKKGLQVYYAAVKVN